MERGQRGATDDNPRVSRMGSSMETEYIIVLILCTTVVSSMSGQIRFILSVDRLKGANGSSNYLGILSTVYLRGKRDIEICGICPF